MSELSREEPEPAENAADEPRPATHGRGSLTVEDDPAGTEDPADPAGTASSDDDPVGPAAHQ